MSSPVLASRLQELQKARDDGHLPEADYVQQRSRMLNEFAGVSGKEDVKGSPYASSGKVASNGFSLDEAAKFADQEQAEKARRSPREVLAELQKGNARFWTGDAARPEKSAFQRRALIGKQFPSVAVIGCADSRVPIELVFDQGLGDIFVIRNAGNTLGTSAMASLQYAVEHLKVKAIVIMGHESCGAVKASMAPVESFSQHPDELAKLLGMIRVGLDADRVNLIRDVRAKDREAVVSNVQYQVSRITQDELIMRKVKANELLVTGAFYELSSGIVDFFGEITDTTSENKVQTLRRMSVNPEEFNLAAVGAPGARQTSESSDSDDDASKVSSARVNKLPNLLHGERQPSKKDAALAVGRQ